MGKWLNRLFKGTQEAQAVALDHGPQAGDWERQSKELESIPMLDFNATPLMSEREINLDEIFRSPEIEAYWSAVAPELEAFEIPDGTGGVNPGDRRAIFYLISHLKPRSVLEVGTHIGASTVHIAAALKRSNIQDQKNRSLISVDVSDVNDEVTKPWLQYETRYSPAQLVSSIGCDNFVKFVTKPALGYMSECNEKYDLIFLDGHHAAKSVYQEIPAALRLLKPGGVILLHDVFPELKPLWSNGAIESGPVLATDRIRREGVPVKVLPFGELPWPTKLGSNVTSLALLARENIQQSNAVAS